MLPAGYSNITEPPEKKVHMADRAVKFTERHGVMMATFRNFEIDSSTPVLVTIPVLVKRPGPNGPVVTPTVEEVYHINPVPKVWIKFGL